jgi:hypothetical protein
VPLPTFTGNLPTSHPNWGYGVAKKDLSKLHPMPEVIQQIQCEGLTSMHLQRTFFSRQI